MRSTARIVLGLLVFGRVAATATADRLTVEDVYPRLDRLAYTELIAALDAGPDQHAIAEMLYGDYTEELERLASRFDVEEVKAGRGRLDDALAGRIVLAPDEVRRLRVAVRQATRAGFEEADDLARTLLSDVELVLEVDHQLYLAAGMAVRRNLYMVPRKVFEHDLTYAGDGVDLFDLITAAAAEEGELAGLTLADFEVELGSYASLLDQLLRADALRDWEGRQDLAVARIRRDTAARARLEREAVERWRPFYDLTRRTAEAIRDRVARRLGDPAATRWMVRFNEACFPLLRPATSPEDQLAWIGRRVAEASTVAQARAIVSGYRGERLTRCEEAVALMVRARTEYGALLHTRTRPDSIQNARLRDLYLQLMKNSGELSSLDRTASDQLEALLTKNQRLSMKAELAARAFGRRP